MSKKTIILSTILFTMIVVGMFVFAYLSKDQATEVPEPVQENPAGEVNGSDIDRITAKHYFIDGKHTVVGEIVMPTPCDLLTTDVMVMESYPEQVLINIEVINNAEYCTQVMTTQRFKAEFNASEQAVVAAKFKGEDVVLNLVPAAEGEVPEDYEIFIKG